MCDIESASESDSSSDDTSMCTADVMDDGSSVCDDRVAGSVLDCLTEVESAAGDDDDDDDTEVSLLSPPSNQCLLTWHMLLERDISGHD